LCPIDFDQINARPAEHIVVTIPSANCSIYFFLVQHTLTTPTQQTKNAQIIACSAIHRAAIVAWWWSRRQQQQWLCVVVVAEQQHSTSSSTL
jgi:hypothetical protein